MIKNLIFDMNGVLVYDSYYELFTENGFPLQKISEFEQVLYSREAANIWEKREAGDLTDSETVKELTASFPDYKDMIEIAVSKEANCTKEYGAVGLLKPLHNNGYRIYILSNYAKTPFMEILDRKNFKENIDGYVVSCDEKTRKPDLKMFKVVCSRYGLVPAECIYFDDRRENVEAAKTFGMEGIQIRSPEILEFLLEGICSGKFMLQA